MGACFNEQIYDGKLTKQEVQKAFNDLQDEERSYYGSDPYNGSFSNCDCRVRFIDKIFNSVNEAYDYLEDSLDKRDVAVVKAKEGDKEVWVLGSWCPE